MHCHLYSATVLAAITAGIIAPTDAQAAARVGGAVNVVRDVSGSSSGQSWTKKVEGDDVYENEFIRTALESSARISFIDETDIKIGPAATMKIDRVVLKTNRSVTELIVSADAGALRWNSGISQSSAYQVKTPTAIIKVHGTTFDLFVELQQTTVVLRRGTIEVCSIDTPQRCRTLSRPGDTIIATPNNLDRPQRAGPGPSEFADRCLSAANMAPCAIMASLQPTRTGTLTAPTTGSVTTPTTGGVTTPAIGSLTTPTIGSLTTRDPGRGQGNPVKVAPVPGRPAPTPVEVDPAPPPRGSVPKHPLPDQIPKKTTNNTFNETGGVASSSQTVTRNCGGRRVCGSSLSKAPAQRSSGDPRLASVRPVTPVKPARQNSYTGVKVLAQQPRNSYTGVKALAQQPRVSFRPTSVRLPGPPNVHLH